MEETGEDFIITWHGGPVVSGCEFFFEQSHQLACCVLTFRKSLFPVTPKLH
jgi:hypothetical protein